MTLNCKNLIFQLWPSLKCLNISCQEKTVSKTTKSWKRKKKKYMCKKEYLKCKYAVKITVSYFRFLIYFIILTSNCKLSHFMRIK